MRTLFTCLLALRAGAAAHGAELNSTEARWLRGALPVLQHAKASGLPLDIVVQPQPAPGLPPLALAFIGGRCKFVLSMRDNPAAQRALDSVEPVLLDAALELMAAHELGHCLRHLSGRWESHPDGAAPVFPAALPAERRADHAQMQATRREEGYGDLAGLAWIAHRRPAEYARLYRWLVRERSAGLLPGSHHDTLAWLRLAEQPSALAGAGPFDRVHEVWLRGMVAAH
jgi:hypothetical protein